jgi:hypothetical protein
VKTLASRNDGVARSLPASTLVGGRIGVDLDERVLNSILKGRTVGRIGPLGMVGSLICRGNSQLHSRQPLAMLPTRCLEEIVCDRKPIFARLATASRIFPDVGCTKNLSANAIAEYLMIL